MSKNNRTINLLVAELMVDNDIAFDWDIIDLMYRDIEKALS